MQKEFEEFLLRCGAAQTGHSGRKLIDHLKGTYEILCAWECEQSTRAAGLFHSIYGTNAFRRSSLDVNHRELLKTLIGDEAENLVYLFHASRRPGSWLQALEHGGSISRIDGQLLTFDEACLAKLIEIECANLIEQNAGKEFLRSLTERPEAFDLVASNALIANAIRNVV